MSNAPTPSEFWNSQPFEIRKGLQGSEIQTRIQEVEMSKKLITRHYRAAMREHNKRLKALNSSLLKWHREMADE